MISYGEYVYVTVNLSNLDRYIVLSTTPFPLIIVCLLDFLHVVYFGFSYQAESTRVLYILRAIKKKKNNPNSKIQILLYSPV